MDAHKLNRISAAGVLVTLGIIFGDIGTSPLYVLKAIIGEGNVINRVRAKSKDTWNGSSVYGHTESGDATKLNGPGDVDTVDSNGKLKYKKFTIKTESLAEALNSRILNNLRGSEYILSETFKK